VLGGVNAVGNVNSIEYYNLVLRPSAWTVDSKFMKFSHILKQL
jgi:hypothetical protein